MYNLYYIEFKRQSSTPKQSIFEWKISLDELNLEFGHTPKPNKYVQTNWIALPIMWTLKMHDSTLNFKWNMPSIWLFSVLVLDAVHFNFVHCCRFDYFALVVE